MNERVLFQVLLYETLRLTFDESAHISFQIVMQIEDILIQFSYAYPSDKWAQAFKMSSTKIVNRMCRYKTR